MTHATMTPKKSLVYANVSLESHSLVCTAAMDIFEDYAYQFHKDLNTLCL